MAKIVNFMLCVFYHHEIFLNCQLLINKLTKKGLSNSGSLGNVFIVKLCIRKPRKMSRAI